MNSELDEHLGYGKYQQSDTENSRKGFSRKPLKTEDGKDYKAVTADLKLIDQSVTETEALLALEQYAVCWDEKYPQISRSWRGPLAQPQHPLFDYPEDIRKAIYTSNAIESLNSVIRKALQKRKLFPSNDSAK